MGTEKAKRGDLVIGSLEDLGSVSLAAGTRERLPPGHQPFRPAKGLVNGEAIRPPTPKEGTKRGDRRKNRAART